MCKEYVMQLTPRYLVKNKTTIVADLATGAITEYRPVYARDLKAYRGIDNVLTFEVKNNDQKPVSILNTYTPKFVAYDENKTLVLEKTGTVIETSTPSYKGQFTVNITANDLLNTKDQFLTYSIYLVKDSDDSQVLTYANAHFESCGTISVDSCAFPGPKDPVTIDTFAGVDDVYTSEYVDAHPALNGNDALHTAAIYSTDFAGTVTIQGSLENQNPTNWVDITTTTLASPTEPTPINFNGVFNFIRAKYETSNSGTIDKILVRN